MEFSSSHLCEAAQLRNIDNMPIHNVDIANQLNKLADLLEIQGGNPFRVRAYHNAARYIADNPRNMAAMLSEGVHLDDLPGIGPSIAGKIKEILQTGHLSALENIEHKLPGHLAELLEIPGLGPKKVKNLHEALHINSLTDLAEAVKAHRIQGLRGFGIKTEERLAEEVLKRSNKPKRLKLYAAEQVAAPLIQYLQAIPGVKEVVIAGSYRRRCETVGDVDILVTCRKDSPVMAAFVRYEDVVHVLSQGPTRATIILRGGLQVDLRVMPQKSYGAALLYFTGSKPHNITLRTIAAQQGLKINEYGVFKGEKYIAGRTEEEIYRLFGYSYIEPELREAQGELDAARMDKLPKLVTINQIRGDLHAHTQASDGQNTIEEMALAAKARGYEYLAITDHTRHTTVAHGLDEKRYRAHLDEIDRVNAQITRIRILKSAEVDILEDGSLDLPDSVLRKMDVVICSIHARFNLSNPKQTERIIRALDNPNVNIFCHPTGRLINEREPYDVNLERVMQAALARGCYLELNAQPDRLDLNDHFCRMAKETGLKVVISSDAHKVSDLDFMRFGIDQARRAWLEADDILNTRTWNELKKLLKRP